jgi:hypothetical protein
MDTRSTPQHEKKSTYHNNGVHVDAYDVTDQEKYLLWSNIRDLGA